MHWVFLLISFLLTYFVLFFPLILQTRLCINIEQKKAYKINPKTNCLFNVDALRVWNYGKG